jgi:hypothetical protein
MQAQENARRAARRPEGSRYLPRNSRNAAIRDESIVREPIPESHGAAELWICYTPRRKEFLRLRELTRHDEQLAKDLAITRELCDPDALNGYVAFNKRRAPSLPKECPLVDFVPVHGGVTYTVKDSIAAVWGFDTLHVNSEKLPRTDQVWIKTQCLVLYEHLTLADRYWPEYRRAGRDRRIEILKDVFGPLREAQELGMGGMMRMMFDGV